MKTVRHNRRSRDPVLHIETELGVVNIRIGLHETSGREVTSVEIIPDPECVRDGSSNVRLIGPKSKAPAAKAPAAKKTTRKRTASVVGKRGAAKRTAKQEG